VVANLIPLVQTRTGKNGNCMATALASILECEVPEFGMDVTDEEWWQNLREWLKSKGYRYRHLPTTAAVPEGYYIMVGKSWRGGRHAVVGKGGKIVHDPHPEDGTKRGLATLETLGILEPLGRPMKKEKGMCPVCNRAVDMDGTGAIEKHGKCEGAGCPSLVVEDHGEAFRHLEHSLAHRKGVTHPRALAAWIGRKSLGKKEMERRALEGKQLKAKGK
jgi:hypothetical protein